MIFTPFYIKMCYLRFFELSFLPFLDRFLNIFLRLVCFLNTFLRLVCFLNTFLRLVLRPPANNAGATNSVIPRPTPANNAAAPIDFFGLLYIQFFTPDCCSGPDPDPWSDGCCCSGCCCCLCLSCSLSIWVFCPCIC